jgi:hypothetical protein
MCQGNICTCPAPRIMARMQDVTFCAHDEAETRIHWTNTARWVLVNNRGLYLEYDELHRAFGDMYAITGVTLNNFTMLGE